MTVPFIDLKRFEDGFLNTWEEKVSEISKTASFIGGQEVENLENSLALVTENKFAITCANGTDAIQLALRALDIGPGDIVLIPNMTFWATFEAVVNVGASPLTVDSETRDGGVDIHAFMEAVEKFRPKAAVIAHLYGWGTDKLANLRNYCSAGKVLLIEDGAQCFGAKYQDNSIYKQAQIATTSFYPAKVLGAAGDGGAVFTSNELLAKKVRQLANHGRTSNYRYGLVGWNSRLDSLQAAYLNLALEFLPKRIISRVEAIRFYQYHLSDIGIHHMKAPKSYQENGYCHVGLISDLRLKKKIETSLSNARIGFGNIYPGPMSEQQCSHLYMSSHVGGNMASQICETVINLPVFPYISEQELWKVVDTVKTVCEGHLR